MMIPHLIAALFTALLVVLVFAMVGQRGPWAGLAWFFLIVFLGAWAVGTWITPMGPILWGIAWAPFLFGALIFALLLAAVTPPRPRRVAADEPVAEREPVAVGLFFWLLVALLVVAILAGA